MVQDDAVVAMVDEFAAKCVGKRSMGPGRVAADMVGRSCPGDLGGVATGKIVRVPDGTAEYVVGDVTRAPSRAAAELGPDQVLVAQHSLERVGR